MDIEYRLRGEGYYMKLKVESMEVRQKGPGSIYQYDGSPGGEFLEAGFSGEVTLGAEKHMHFIFTVNL